MILYVKTSNDEATMDQFWVVSDGSVKFPKHLLIEWLQKQGFYKSIIDSKGHEAVYINGNIVERIAQYVIKDYITSYLKSWQQIDAIKAFLEISFAINSSFLELLESIELEILKDSNSECYFPFKNGVINVSADSIKLIPYVKLKKVVWKNTIIDRTINEKESGDSVFKLFLENVSGLNKDQRLAKTRDINLERVSGLMSAIGYLISNFKKPSLTKAVILTDLKLGNYEDANGGTGKGILGTAISKLRKTCIKDGKHLKPGGNRFFYQEMEPGSNVMWFDDLSPDFDFSLLYPVLTTGMHFERKYEHARYIPFEETPKLLLATNYVVKAPMGSSTERRKWEFEVSDYYGLDYTPEDEFGKMFFDEWDDSEWNSFFMFMFECNKLFLKKGLIKVSEINLTVKKFYYYTSPEFVEFANENIEFNKEYNKSNLFSYYQELNPNSKISSHRFTKFLKTYCELFVARYSERKSDGNYLVTFNKRSTTPLEVAA